jgi:cobaltochelatase CobS
MLKGMYPIATDKLLSSTVKIANLCRSAYVQGNLNTIMSLRVLSSWIQHSLNLKDIDKALELSFLNRFDSEGERQTVREFVNVTMGKGR